MRPASCDAGAPGTPRPTATLRVRAAGLATAVLAGATGVLAPSVASSYPATAWPGAATRHAVSPAVGAATPSEVSLHRIAVFGQDERVFLTDRSPDRYKDVVKRLGRISNGRSGTVCSAFCVAPNVVATASHCLFKPTGGRPAKLDDFYFQREGASFRERATIAGSSVGATMQNVLAGLSRLRIDPPINAAQDWALVRLSRSACDRGVIPVRPATADEINKNLRWNLFQIGYHRDLGSWQPAHSPHCEVNRSFPNADWTTIQKDFSDTTHLVLHTCDTGSGSSGSPLLLDTPGGIVAVAINVGTYIQSKVLDPKDPTGAVAATASGGSDAVANTAVAGVAFADRIAKLRDAAVLLSVSHMRDLQTLLREMRHYEGKIDGSYGPLLKAAIESYERSIQRPPTGLATEDLLVRLGGPLVETPPARFLPSAGDQLQRR